jgi:hypothetical protein
MAELRKNGGFDYMAKLYDEKMNAISSPARSATRRSTSI